MAASGRVSFHGRVGAVVDGRTIKVKTQGGRQLMVRLLGVDAPRLKTRGHPLECGAKEAVSNLLYGTFLHPRDTDGDGLVDRAGGKAGRVFVQSDPSQPTHDRAGRLLAYVAVELEGQEYLDTRAIGYGNARPRYPRSGASRATKVYRALRSARRDRDGEGIWSLCGGHAHRKAARKGRRPTAAERKKIEALADMWVRIHREPLGLHVDYRLGQILVSRHRPLAKARLLLLPGDEHDDGSDDESREPLIINLRTGNTQGPDSQPYCAPADVRDELGIYCH
jgi:endonuclease YncB( thermonuclease family)